MASRRREIANLITTELQNINGSISSYDASYTYNTNLYNKVSRGLKFLDEINSFPSIQVKAGIENRTYETLGLITATLDITLYCYVKSGDSQEDIELLINDIEHVIYNINLNPSYGLMDISIGSITTDAGLIDNYGFAEVLIVVQYEIAE